MQPIEAFHHLGLLSLASLIVGIGYVLRRWGTQKVFSMSRHAGRQRHSALIFSTTLLLSIALTALFAFGWLVPRFLLPGVFTVMLAIGLICATVAAIVPDTGSGWQGKAHGVGAWTMAALLPFLVIVLLFAAGVGVLAKFFLAILLSYMILDWFLFIFVRWSRRYFLIFQASYVFCFYVALLVVAYLG
jgi:hypothetical protein